MSQEVEALNAAKRFLREEVAPKAQQIDSDPELLRDIVDRMGECELLAMLSPERFGGPSMSGPIFRTYQEEAARVSGAFAFLTTQHQSAVAMIANGDNEALQAAYLPDMASGKRRVGIGFSQLRRSGPPIMRAESVDGGFLLNGQVPWVTGWTFYPEFLAGASLPDGRSVFLVVPLEETSQPTRGGNVCLSAPMQLAAMTSAMTVSVEFRGYFVADEKLAFIKPAGWIKNNDAINIALQGHFAIGCAMAGIDVVRQNAERKPFPFLGEILNELESELGNLRLSTGQAQVSSDESTTPERLKVRAWAIDFAVRCAHAAVASSSGAANSVTHPAQRIYREALVYTVSAQTPDIMEATLRRLTSRRMV